MATIGMFDFDPLVVKGWNDKLNLSEAQLSQFVPFVKLFVVLNNDDKDSRIVEIVGKGQKRIKEIGKIISQTQDKATFRGGIGLTELSTRYAAVEAGALELRLGVIISDFNQFELDENESAIKLFHPGTEFLIIYGWETSGNSASIFINNSIPKINLENFDYGMRRYLYCTLHHFEWELGDQGRIYGTLHFWTPDTVRMSLKSLENNNEDLNYFLLNDLSEIDLQFLQDVDKHEKNENSENKQVSKEIANILKTRTTILTKDFLNKIPFNRPTFYENQFGFGFLRKIPIPSSSPTTKVNAETIIDKDSKKVYLGWILETLKFIYNSKSKDDQQKIYFKYKNLDITRTVNFSKNYFGDNIDNNSQVEHIEKNVQFSNVFFTPINLTNVMEFIRTFKGNFKFFIDSLLQYINEEFDGTISYVLRIDNGIYEIDDIKEKLIKQDKRLRKNINGKTYYRNDSQNIPVLGYGFSNSLVYNVKISSTIPPDIMWGQELAKQVSEKKASELINKAINTSPADLQKEENKSLRGIKEQLDLYNEEIEKRNKQTQGIQSVKQIYVPGRTPDKDKEVINRAIDKDRTIIGAVVSDNIVAGNVSLGTIVRNYFNGLTITIHGTSGFQVFKSILFKGFELLSSKKGIDGLYHIVMVNDIITPKGYETVIETKRINSLPIE